MKYAAPPIHHSFFIVITLLVTSLSGCTSPEPNGEVHKGFDPENPLGGYADKSPSPSEQEPGGNTTGKTSSGALAFNFPIPRFDGNAAFHTGNALFDVSWVPATQVPTAKPMFKHGLGPFFNQPACGTCHTQDGRARGPVFPDNERFDSKGNPKELTQCSDVNNFGGMLFRISIPKAADPAHPSIPLSQADPVYGDQLEPFAISTMLKGGEATQCLTWHVMTKADYGGQYVVELKEKNGSTKTVNLVRPTPSIRNWNYGAPAGNPVYISPRIGPQVIGMGLLEAIPIEQLKAHEDPDDRDNDGISGRLMIVPEFTDMDGISHKNIAGRFGWKAEQPTVSAQTAGAFLGDMGITTPLHRVNICLNKTNPDYLDCLAKAFQSKANPPLPEISKQDFTFVVTYTSVLAVPPRNYKPSEEDKIIRGWRLFRSIGCDKCHVPSFTVEESQLSPVSKSLKDTYGKNLFRGQTIYPYTDLLVHDMGPGLCDGRPPSEPNAAGSCEWRTPPLWGIGRIPDVNGHNQLLHDGRATGVEEAILWHGGEAKKQKDYYTMLKEEDRDALVLYVNSL